jgi:hypothetical protein
MGPVAGFCEHDNEQLLLSYRMCCCIVLEIFTHFS